MEFVITRAVPDDAAALLELLKISGGETDNLTFGAEGLPFTVEQERENLANMTGANAMFVAKMGERMVGCIGVHGVGRSVRMAHRASFGINVLKEYWGQGVGSALLQTAIDFAREAGIAVLSLEVRSDNTRAIALYEKFGFRKIGHFPDFFRVGGESVDFELMNLYL